MESPPDAREEALKCLYAAYVLADGYGKSKTAARFLAAHDALKAEPPDECAGAHDTTEMLFAGTSQQGVVCKRCKRFLPC